MSIRYRRFEILLPLRFNDGNPVPDDLLAHTFLELRTEFGRLPLPQWHKDVLDSREKLIQAGKAKFMTWAKAKGQIRRRVK